MSELSQAIARQQDTGAERSAPTVAELLERQKAEIALALPHGMTADRFARVVLTEIRRTPKLRQCTAASLLGAVMLSAQLGLEPGPMQLSYIVPRWNKNVQANEAQFQIGYRGMIDLARRAGTLDVAAHVVHEHDEFDYAYGLEPVLFHKPTLDADAGDVIAAYAVARFPSGGSAFVVLSVAQIEARRERSATPTAGPWVTDWEAMARKTAVRALEPLLPRSVELAQASKFDGAVVTDYTSDLVGNPDDVLDVHEIDAGTGDEASAATATDGTTVEAEASPVPAVEELEPVARARARVAEYRAVRKAGATARHRELDEYLVTELNLDVDLERLNEGLDDGTAGLILEWLDAHPIGKP